MSIEIPLPAIDEQRKIILREAMQEAIRQLEANLDAPSFPGQDEVDEAVFGHAHLLRENEGWQPPSPDLVGAYFRHFQKIFPDYGTDGKLAALLGLSSDRRVREYKQGSRKVPYGIWRRFLVMTGRAPQDIIPVLFTVNESMLS